MAAVARAKRSAARGAGRAAPPPSTFQLRLYIAGTSPRSARAIHNAKQICDEHLAGRYQLEVVDLFQQPGRAKDDQVVAAPTLIKRLPAPLTRIIGDLSDHDAVLAGLAVRRT